MPALTGFSREAVEELSRLKGEPAWVREQRLAAWAVYEALPFPQRTDEEWRRTDLRGLKLDRLRPFLGLDGFTTGVAVDPTMDIATVSAGEKNAGVTIQQDARTVRSELDPEIAAAGVIFTDLDSAFRDHGDLVRRYFMTQAVPSDFGKYEALHAALWQGGSFLYVPAGVTVELPFRAFVRATEAGGSVFSHTLAVLEEGAEAFLVDAYGSPSLDGQAFTSAVVEHVLAADAKLRYVQVQDWGRNVWSFMTERSLIADDATLNSLHVTLGSRFSKSSMPPACKGRTASRRCSAFTSATATSSSTTTPGSSTSRPTRPATWSSRAPSRAPPGASTRA
jgi:Fe-S cluster assembly protein SufD